ncbi:FAD binding domain protein [Mycobacterium ulcerans str. Harvey]|uniref:Delta(24)-sterol reductase n=1 Tax=Mycobacterium ulcerans str. Harvey TaxID=1299332 RepID=A0ABN0QPQ4_MYCUL|nr:FAD binding domain protein [Mycobacterium ulcerans str. Harvey]
MLASYRSIPTTATVRLAKPTSNLFRARAKRDVRGLDTSGLTGVISIDPDARTADVAGMCTYEDLVAATLPHGLSPLVVPQLKTITLGGAVTGLGIESASFRNGLPHESVLEMDVLTGAGELLTVSADRNADLYRAFPNSYGTLGYSTRLKILLEPVKPFVALQHIRFDSLRALVAAMERIVDTGAWTGWRWTTWTAWSSAPTKATCASVCGPQRRARSAITPEKTSTTGRSSTRAASKRTA